MKIAKFASIYFTCLLGIIPVAAFAQPYVISADGSEVTDPQSGLIWRRCAEGMTWSGVTCVGTASTYTHDAAFQRATSQAGSVGWRLPNIKELSSIVDRSLANPAIDLTTFPGTPPNLFWSSSPFVSLPSSAEVVDFGLGVVGGTNTNRNDLAHPYYVRLVRDGA